MNPKLTPERLSRRAIVYIRQSSPVQVMHNQESQRRQYGLQQHARGLGFRDVVVVDEDLGKSGSGLVERPGFQRVVADVCTGEVGAILCIEASRLARNGRDWHHLIELCGMVGAVVIDPDGVYDPGLLNDRLLLGLKGTMSEFELNLLRQRSAEAVRQKAHRGELQFCLPIGYIWTPAGKVEMDPDLRVQQALQLVFSKMTELGSVRQTLLWFRSEAICLPAKIVHQPGQVEWKLPLYNAVHRILTNPIYAGAYAFGKTGAQIKVVGGRARKASGHRKPREEWMVLIREHHPGYISWEQFERNQALLAANSNMKSRMEPKAGRGGRALLAGILRCRRCGRMLHVGYSGREKCIRYHCRGAVDKGDDWCITFGGLRVDQAIAKEVLQAIEGDAVEAALEAAGQMQQQREQQRNALSLELEQAQYEAKLAARRYEAVDPDRRLVAAELEARWDAALQETKNLEAQLNRFDRDSGAAAIPDREILISLAQDLPAVWNGASTDMRLKQRIVRILVHEIVADTDETAGEIVLLIHWAGGRHSELRIKKNPSGKHSKCTADEAVEVVRQMAGKYSDERIAATLNRLGLKTGAGNGWSELRVRTLRCRLGVAEFDPATVNSTTMTLEQAAEKLAVSVTVVRRLIAENKVPAAQVIQGAPWEISIAALDSAEVRQEALRIKNRTATPRTPGVEEQEQLFSMQ
ncbi:MAG TPA: recombinase family protein [Terriglobales bacterium]|nr:recombinase family protein [Terriglobales bacterium]